MTATPISLSASPFTFTAPEDGRVIISAGGINNLEFSQDGAEWRPIGSYRGMFPLRAGERLRLSWNHEAPNVDFVS